MAYEIPEDFVLLPDRYVLSLEVETIDCCVGIVEQEPVSAYGSMSQTFSLKKMSNGIPGEEPIPGVEITYNRVIFKREHSQEVKIGETDYFIVHSNNILGFIQPE